MQVSRHQALAYRVAAHHLDDRLPPGSLLDAAGVGGVQDTAPGAAVVALHARSAGVSLDGFHAALYADRTLTRTYSVRAASCLVPTADLSVFTRGLLPSDDAGILAVADAGVEPALAELGLSATDVLALAIAAVEPALGKGELTKEQLGLAVADAVESRLKRRQRQIWRQPSWYASDERLGESLVRSFLPIVALTGRICCGTRHGRQPSFVRTDWWLSRPPVFEDPERARAQLVRRFLHAYGPATPEGFAEWAGMTASDAARSWRLVADELTPVDLAGDARAVLTADVPALTSPPTPRGVRLLAPFDPYLQSPDRSLLVGEEARRRAIWRSSGWPGVVLVDGELAGLWRRRQTGSTLTISVAPFERLRPEDLLAIRTEAEQVAPLTDAARAEVKLVET